MILGRLQGDFLTRDKMTNRILIFDYIKIFSFCSVIITHLPALSDARKLEIGFPYLIAQAVPFFLIISSFLFDFYATDRKSYTLILDKLGRIVSTYALTFLLVYLVVLLTADSPISVIFSVSGNPIVSFLVGGQGPGGYYIPILIQLYLLMPFLDKGMKADRVKTTAVLLLLNICFEIGACYGYVPGAVYRVCIIRYLAFLLVGRNLRIAWDAGWFLEKGSWIAVPLSLLFFGAVYISAINYFDFSPLSLRGAWQNTSWATAGYSGSIVCLLLLLEKRLDGCRTLSSSVVQLFSRAAFDVYLSQMLIFTIVRFAFGNFSVWGDNPLSLVLELIVLLPTCLLFGVVCYRIRIKILKARSLMHQG